MVLGSLIRGLSRIGLWPIPEAEAITMSVSALSSKLLGITCYLPQFIASKTSSPASSTLASAQSSRSSNTAGSSLFSQASSPPFGNSGSQSLFSTLGSTQSPGNSAQGSGETNGGLFSQRRPVQAPIDLPSQSEIAFGGGANANNLFGKPNRPETASASQVKVDAKPAHENCDFTIKFRADVQRILDQMESGVLDEHRTHLIEQERMRSTVLSRAL